ncbi:MAG TPA: hypothetical protein VFX79_02755 [Candidatus Saccharimonadales bacterium]|nr:hypothetical protein [Candidatus Saccharimonadales bacterium]
MSGTATITPGAMNPGLEIEKRPELGAGLMPEVAGAEQAMVDPAAEAAGVDMAQGQAEGAEPQVAAAQAEGAKATTVAEGSEAKTKTKGNGIRTGVALLAASLTIMGAKELVKPASAEGSLGLFGPKITKTKDMEKYVNFRLKNGGDCDPVRDGMAEALGLKSDRARDRYLTPGNVTVISRFRARNGQWKTSTGANGCESVDIANVHSKSVGFRYALKKIPGHLKEKFALIKKGKHKGMWRVKDAALRGECGAQTIKRTPKRPPRKPQSKDFSIDVTAGIAAKLKAEAESESRSQSTSSTTVTCPDGSTFSANINSSAYAQGLAAAAARLKASGRGVVITRSELTRGNGATVTDLRAAFRGKFNAFVGAAANTSTSTQVDQQVSVNCGPGEKPPGPNPEPENNPPTGVMTPPQHRYPNSEGPVCVDGISDPDGDAVTARNFDFENTSGQDVGQILNSDTNGGVFTMPGSNGETQCVRWRAPSEPMQVTASAELSDGRGGESQVMDNFPVIPNQL